MGEIKRVVSNLVKMLDREQKKAKTLVDTMHILQSYLEEESKTIIHGSLDRLLIRIRVEAAKRTTGSVVVLVSPEGRVTVGETYNISSDSWLGRLKSQGFWIMRLEEFSSFIDSLKSEVAGGNSIPVIEFLRANTQFPSPLAYSPPAHRVSQQSPTSSEWKLSDFLPALPPHPPLPRGLFKD